MTFDEIETALDAIPDQNFGVALLLSDLLEDAGDYDSFYHAAGFVDGVVGTLMHLGHEAPQWLAKIQRDTIPDLHPDADARLTSTQRQNLIRILEGDAP